MGLGKKPGRFKTVSQIIREQDEERRRQRRVERERRKVTPPPADGSLQERDQSRDDKKLEETSVSKDKPKRRVRPAEIDEIPKLTKRVLVQGRVNVPDLQVLKKHHVDIPELMRAVFHRTAQRLAGQ